MIVYDKPPFATIGRKSLSVSAPADLEGKVLGAPPPDFATENVDTVTTFLGAVAEGWKAVIADPEMGAKAVAARNPAADVALETRRLQLAIDANVLTDNVMANGMGQVDAARMERALAQLGETYEFKNAPDASLYFTDAYLPSADMLMLK